MNDRLIQDEHVCKLARGLILAFESERDLRAQRHKVKAQAAWQRLEGMCDSAYRLGFGMTPTMVLMAVKDTDDEIPLTIGPQANRELRMAEQARRVQRLADKLWKMR